MSVEISIDSFDMREFERLTALFLSYFPPDNKLLTENYTRWLYILNPTGIAKIVTAVEGGRWVGFMAMIPVRLAGKDVPLIAYYVVNVLVHPEYQGKHIFGQLIKVAKEFVTAEGSALMGHPNDLALKQWQRSRMHFHEPLRPVVIAPSLVVRGMSSRTVKSADCLMPAIIPLNLQARQSGRCHVELTVAYLRWRYFEHPTNIYQVRLIEAAGSPVGFLVSRRLRPMLNLLIDRFILDPYASDALSRSPWITAAFMSESGVSEAPSSLWRLPLKKRIPFFLTCYARPFASGEVGQMGLSASDF